MPSGKSIATTAPVPGETTTDTYGLESINNSLTDGANSDAFPPSFLDVGKKITWLAIPMALSYTFSFSIVALGLMAGRIRTEEDNQDYIGAAALSATMINTVMIIALSSLFSISILTSKNRGRILELEGNDANTENDELINVREEVSSVLKNSVIISSAVTLAAFFPLFYSQALLTALGQDENVAALAQTYLRPMAYATPGLLFRLCNEQIMLSFEKQIPAMVMGLSSFAVGVFLADMLCFGRYSTPQLNLAGIGYGFLTEAYLTTILFGLYLAFAPIFKNYNFFTQCSFKKEDWQQMKNLLSVGWPITVTLSMEIASTLVTSLFAGMLGTDALIAYSFWAQFYFFVLIPLFALGQATCQEVSRAIGGHLNVNVSRIATYGLLTSCLIILPLCITVSAYPELLEWVITNQEISDEIMQTVKILIPITAGGIMFDTARYNMLQVLRAVGDNVPATLISVANTWLGVLLAYVLGFHTKLGIVGVGLGFTIGLATGALSLFPRWLQKVVSYNAEQVATLSEVTPLLAEQSVGANAPPAWRLCLCS